MHTFEHEVVVNQPIDVVWKNLSCLKGCINWSTLLHDTEKLDAGPAQVGSRYKHISGFMGMTTETIQVIKAWNPPHEFIFGDTEDTKSLMPVENHYTLTEVSGGTRVHHVCTLKPRDNIVGRVAGTVLIPRLERQIQEDLLNFKELVEAGVTIHAA